MILQSEAVTRPPPISIWTSSPPPPYRTAMGWPLIEDNRCDDGPGEVHSQSDERYQMHRQVAQKL